MKSVFKIRLFVAVWISLLLGCSTGSPGTDVAQRAADEFYVAQKQGNTEGALSHFSDKRQQEEWRAHLQHINNSLGKVEKYAMQHDEVNTVLSGRFYIFEYQVAYSSGITAKETLTLFDSVEQGDEPSIVAHMISAEGYKPLF